MGTAHTTGAGSHAIVIGASMAGLLAARVLSEHYGRVTLLERDVVADTPEARRGQPQARHTHALLAGGQQILERYFPGLSAEAVAGGAITGDMAEGSCWYTFGGYRLQFQSGRRGLLASRPFLEWHVRQRVLRLPNIALLDQIAVESLLHDGAGRVTGVAIRHRADGDREDQIAADMVVDASGRGTQAPRWLEALGYGRPPESVVKVDMGYATRIYRAIPGDQHGVNVLASFSTPPISRSGFAVRIEGGRWIVSVGGHHGAHAPTDEAGFLGYVRSLPSPEIADLVGRAEPLGEIIQHKLPSSLRRHYERMRRFPEGYLVLGDAICSFNPIYGQGMTSAAMQAQELDHALRERGSRGGLARAFFRRAARVVDTPWQLAVGEDFRFPDTTGPRPLGLGLLNAYVAQLHRATHTDPVVYAAFLQVMNLLAPPASLLAPRIMLRVLRAGWSPAAQGPARTLADQRIGE